MCVVSRGMAVDILMRNRTGLNEMLSCGCGHKQSLQAFMYLKNCWQNVDAKILNFKN